MVSKVIRMQKNALESRNLQITFHMHICQQYNQSVQF